MSAQPSPHPISSRRAGGEPAIVDITASMRRKARKDAAKVLVAAGWDINQISLAFGVGMGAAMQLMPEGWTMPADR